MCIIKSLINNRGAMASIESSKQSVSAVESFSRNWVVNLQVQGKSREGSFRASSVDDSNSFIEMDPKLPPSQRFFRVNTQDLITFDFPLPSEDRLVHADELIYNGYLMPLVLKPLLLENNNNTDQDSTISDDSSASSSNSNDASMSLASPNSLLLMDGGNSNDEDEDQVHGSGGRVMRCASLKRCPKRMLRKYLDFLRPFLQKIGGCRNGNRAKVSPAASTSSCAGYSPQSWRRSCDSESSIYEAVLHCKRTIGS